MNALRIAMVGTKGVPARDGGIQRVTEELGARLVERGHDLLVYCRHHYTGKDIGEHRGMRLEYLPSVKTKHLDALTHSVASLLHSVVVENPDIIHLHSFAPTLAAWLPRFTDTALILHVHGTGWEKTGKWGPLARAYLRFGERSCAAAADHIVTCSHVLCDEFEKYGRPVSLLRYGVTAPGEAAGGGTDGRSGIARLGLDEGHYILYVGRLVRGKGCHHLVRAYRELETTMPLVFAGQESFSDEYSWELHRLADPDPRIRFLGFVEDHLLQELYRKAYLFVHPSETEGLSMALLEAMSLGTCVLTSDIPANVMAHEGHAFTFRSGNHAALKSSLEDLLMSPDKVSRAARSGAEFVRRTYTWESTVTHLEEIYGRVLNRS